MKIMNQDGKWKIIKVFNDEDVVVSEFQTRAGARAALKEMKQVPEIHQEPEEFWMDFINERTSTMRCAIQELKRQGVNDRFSLICWYEKTYNLPRAQAWMEVMEDWDKVRAG